MAASLVERSEAGMQDGLLPTGTDGPAPQRAPSEAPPAARRQELKHVAAERLAAHRSRRAAAQASEEEQRARSVARAETARSASRRGSAMVREAVAERYRQTQSYREFLAAEAERALQQAQAEAEVAARTMAAVADAQRKLLEEIRVWEEEQPATAQKTVPAETTAEDSGRAQLRGELAHALADIALGARELIAEPRLRNVVEAPAAVLGERPALTVRLLEDVSPAPRIFCAPPARKPHSDVVACEELEELEEEIAFRRAPEFGPRETETQPIPANIIEFPRQLIAARKARPRLAEGPLLEEAPREPQLRIFEVEPEQIGIEPAPAAEPTGAPVWQSLLLEAYTPAPASAPQEAQASLTFQPQAAPTGRRVMAATVDALCIVTAFIGFATLVAWLTGPALRAVAPPLLAGSAVVALATFFLVYRTLFFTFSDATPGMRYARIALCTFGDDNPTRQAMRRRTLAVLLAACPLGLGFAWMLMDNDRLGWHDRISRMYQRAY